MNRVKMRKKFSTSFQIYTEVFFSTKSGCRQGGIESPSIFNCYFDWVMRKIFYSVNNEIKPSNNIQTIANYESSMANSAKEPYPCIIESNAIRSQEIQREPHLEPLSTSQSGRKTSYENKHVIRNIKRNTFHRKKLSTLWISSENIFQFSNLDLKVVVRKIFFQF